MASPREANNVSLGLENIASSILLELEKFRIIRDHKMASRNVQVLRLYREFLRTAGRFQHQPIKRKLK